MQNTFTKNELTVLETFTHSDFYENGRNSVLWDFSVLDILDMKARTRSGVFSSLQQKGFIEVTEKEKMYILDENGKKTRNPYYHRGEPNFGTYLITLKGYEALDKLELIDEDGYFHKDKLDTILNS